MKSANNLDLKGARLLNAIGLTDASGNLVVGVAYNTVASYADLIALATPSILTITKVDYDSKVGKNNAMYYRTPDGFRFFVSASSDKDMVELTQTGTIISDGGGYYNNDPQYAPAKAFDDDKTTFYNTAATGSGVTGWVGRDFGSAMMFNWVSLDPRQDSAFATRLNGALLQSSTNGSTWSTIATVSGVTGSNYVQSVILGFAPVTARYVRVLVQEGNVAGIKIKQYN